MGICRGLVVYVSRWRGLCAFLVLECPLVSDLCSLPCLPRPPHPRTRPPRSAFYRGVTLSQHSSCCTSLAGSQLRCAYAMGLEGRSEVSTQNPLSPTTWCTFHFIRLSGCMLIWGPRTVTSSLTPRWRKRGKSPFSSRFLSLNRTNPPCGVKV